MRSDNLLALSSLALAVGLFIPQALVAQYDISTVAGGGPNSLTALNASIGYPDSIAFDSAGNTYIADSYSSHIFKVDTSGNLTLIAGNGTHGYSGDGGPASSAAFGLFSPEGLAVDSSGNIFIADTDNSVVREIVASTGNIQTVAGNVALGAGFSGDGGPATSAQLNDPFGIFVDGSGNIFIADADNCVIRKVNAGNISTVAGNGTLQQPCGYAGDGGPATSAQLDVPEGVFVDSAGNIFIADSYNNFIRVVNTGTAPVMIAGLTIAPGNIQTVAGSNYNSQGGTACGFANDGQIATTAQLCAPSGVFADGTGNIFITDTNNFAIREVAASTVNVITTVAGTLGVEGYSPNGTLATSANLNYPNNILVDGSGNIFIADTDNFVIREVTAGSIQTVIGNNFLAYSGDGGTALNGQLNYPGGVVVDGSGDIFIADSDSSVIREVLASGDIQTVAGTGTTCALSTAACGDAGLATSAQLNNPYGVFLDASGNVFIADTENNRIRAVNTGAAPVTIATIVIAPGDIATVAGTGTQGYGGDGAVAVSAELFSPFGVFVDSAGNIFIADSDNHRIREVAAATGIITTVAGTGTQCSSSSAACGDGGAAISAQLADPNGIFVDSSENIYIADTGDNRIRQVAASNGNISTVAGTGNPGYAGDGAAAVSAQLTGPSSVFVDVSGNIFIVDRENFVVREVVGTTGFIATVAGNTNQGFSGDGGQSTSAELNLPFGLFGDATGNLFIADTDNSRIRKLVPTITAPSATSPPAQTASPGGTATYLIQLNANSGDRKYAITLSCLPSSLPANASCSFSPATITPGPLPVPFTLTVTIPASSASLKNFKGTRTRLLFAFMPLVGILFSCAGLRNARGRWLGLAVLCVVMLGLNGCGGGGSSSRTATGGVTYNIQVQGKTSAQSTPVTITTASLTVQ
jgi:sugar lactone lactonase YvrE